MQEHQLASGSTLPSQQTDGFLLLIRQLSQYRNRNSRNIGEQFRQFPCKLRSCVDCQELEKQDGEQGGFTKDLVSFYIAQVADDPLLATSPADHCSPGKGA